MCGRFMIFNESEEKEIQDIVNEVNERYKNQNIMMKTGEIFPTDIVPIRFLRDGKDSVGLLKWGFPGIVSNGTKRNVIINARGETVEEKSMFKDAFFKRRCIIPANGFYEWKAMAAGEKKKQKYIVKVKNSGFFYMAGLYGVFKDVNGNPYGAFVIVTTAASEEMSSIHERMPVMFGSAEEGWAWVKENDAGVLKSMIRPFNNICLYMLH